MLLHVLCGLMLAVLLEPGAEVAGESLSQVVGELHCAPAVL